MTERGPFWWNIRGVMPEMSFDHSQDILIRAGQTVSEPVDLGGFGVFGMKIPDQWTTSAISFRAASDPYDSYGTIKTAAGEKTISSVNGGDYILIDRDTLYGVRYLRIQLGLAGSKETQAEDRIIKLILKRV